MRILCGEAWIVQYCLLGGSSNNDWRLFIRVTYRHERVRTSSAGQSAGHLGTLRGSGVPLTLYMDG